MSKKQAKHPRNKKGQFLPGKLADEKSVHENDNDRNEKGQFQPGNKVGLGNTGHRKAQLLRATLLDAITPAQIQGVIRKLIMMALEGDVSAAKLLLDRCLGPVEAATVNMIEDSVICAVQIIMPESAQMQIESGGSDG